MKVKHFSLKLAFFLFLLFSCQSETKEYVPPKGFHKMSQEEILNMFRQPILPDFERMVRKDSTGKVVTLEELQADTTYDKFADYFADENGVVQELVFRQKTAADEVFIKKMETVFKERRHGFDIELMDVDCGDAKILLEEALIADQDNRKGEGRNDDAVELNNQQVVFSIIEKCGFPRKSELGQKAVDGAFYVLQHAGHKHRVKYFPLVQESVKRGDLELKQLAMMEDRILTREGKRQKYGTQITRSGDGPWVLRPIADVKNVNERRAAVGLEPIEEYLERNGIEFDLVALEKKWQSEGK